MRQNFRRTSVQANVVQRSRSFTFPAPTRGLILNESAVAAGRAGAGVLDNWFPTQTGIRLRGGCRKVATIGTGPVVSMFTYAAGSTRQLFAASATSVFDVTAPPTPTTIPAASFTGQTDGYYSTQQFTTAGGAFLYAVNGIDKPRLYNGSIWTAIDGASSPSLSGAGLDTKKLIHVFAFKNRLFFLERDSMNVWYLPVDSIGGTLSQLSLSGVFQRGGQLLSGGTWSLDTGSGLDDQCVFISSEGEVAIFQGTDPSSTSSWAIRGRYDVTPMMGRRAMISVGGDMLLATRDGVVPLSEVVAKDSSALTLSAVTRAIEPAWKADVLYRDGQPWEMLKWPSMNMGIVSIPPIPDKVPYCWVVNLQTGAWARYTGWSTQCTVLHVNRAYFGTPDGKIMLMENGGSDDGVLYTSVFVGLYDHLKAVGAIKQVHSGRTIFTASQPFNPQVSVGADYASMLPTPPSAAPSISIGTTDRWDAGVWDVSKWDAGVISRVSTRWNSIGSTGIYIAPQVQVTNGALVTPDAELIAFDVIYEAGGVMV